MLKILAMSALALTLTACAEDSKKKGRGTVTGNDSGHGAPVILTDTSRCSTGVPAKSLDGKWSATLQDGDVTFHMLFSFYLSDFTLTNVCAVKGNVVKVSVRSQIRFHNDLFNNSFTVLQSDEDEQEQSFGDGTKIKCSIALAKAMEVKFAFNGSCLDLTTQGETQTLIPASF